jgi:hypothetical protein
MKTHYKLALENLQKEGMFVHTSLDRKKVKGVYGIYANEDIPKDTLLCKVPLNLCIRGNTDETFPDETLNKKVEDRIVICAKILSEKMNPNSKYKHWFKLLPDLKTFKKSLDFNKVKFKTTNSQSISLKNRVKSNRLLFEQIKNFLNVYKVKVKDSDILWVVYLYRTYLWQDLSIPMLDLFNHNLADSYLSPCYDREKNLIGYKLVANRNIKKGEQICISYGVFTLFELAYSYGFYNPDTKLKIVSIKSIAILGVSKLSLLKIKTIINICKKYSIDHELNVIDESLKLTIPKLLISENFLDEEFTKNPLLTNKIISTHMIIAVLATGSLEELENLNTIQYTSRYYGALKELLEIEIIKSNEIINCDGKKYLTQALEETNQILRKLISECDKNLN